MMILKRYLRLNLGLILYAVGIVLTVKGNLGLAPWDAFHIGLMNVIDLTFGQIGILVGVAILFITYFLDESIGLGTIANIFVIGLLIDLILYLNLIPLSQNILSGIIMLILGMVAIAVATYYYISAGFGIGPRDGLMVALTRVTRKPIGLIRGLIEISVLIMGFLLGAKVGFGTVLLAFGTGPIIQMVFKLYKFDVTVVQHEAFLMRKKPIGDQTTKEENLLSGVVKSETSTD